MNYGNHQQTTRKFCDFSNTWKQLKMDRTVSTACAPIPTATIIANQRILQWSRLTTISISSFTRASSIDRAALFLNQKPKTFRRKKSIIQTFLSFQKTESFSISIESFENMLKLFICLLSRNRCHLLRGVMPHASHRKWTKIGIQWKKREKTSTIKRLSFFARKIIVIYILPRFVTQLIGESLSHLLQQHFVLLRLIVGLVIVPVLTRYCPCD